MNVYARCVYVLLLVLLRWARSAYYIQMFCFVSSSLYRYKSNIATYILPFFFHFYWLCEGCALPLQRSPMPFAHAWKEYFRNATEFEWRHTVLETWSDLFVGVQLCSYLDSHDCMCRMTTEIATVFKINIANKRWRNNRTEIQITFVDCVMR